MRVWPNGKALAFQARIKGFDSPGPLHSAMMIMAAYGLGKAGVWVQFPVADPFPPIVLMQHTRLLTVEEKVQVLLGGPYRSTPIGQSG